MQPLNRYAYALNNPTTLTDPSGLGPPCSGQQQCASYGRNYATYQWWSSIWGGGAREFDYAFYPGYESEGEFVPGGIDPSGSALAGAGFFGPFGDGQVPTITQSPSGTLSLPSFPSTTQTNACTLPILSAVNNQFGTSFTPSDVQGSPFSNPPVPRGTVNINIQGRNLTAAQFNAIQTGRYPLSPITWLTGYGSTLHITGATFLNPTAAFSNANIGGVTSVAFTAHIDSAFPYNPIGALIHLLRDVLGVGGRNPCP